MEQNELELVAGMQAFSAMYERIEPRLRERAILILRDAEDVADYMGRCRESLVARACDFDGKRGTFEDWALLTVQNDCLKHRTASGMEIRCDNLEDEPDPLDVIAEVETRVDYEMAIAKLPPMQKKCWQMRDEGYSNGEIARMLGITKHAVVCNIHQSKKSLRLDLAV